jgi:hypothetical protein
MQQLRQLVLTKLGEILEQAERAIADMPESLARARIQHIRGLTKQLLFNVDEQLAEPQPHDSETVNAATSRPG